MTHKNIDLKKNHPPHKQEFANAAQREAFVNGYSNNLCTGGIASCGGTRTGLNPENAFNGLKPVDQTLGWKFLVRPIGDEYIQYRFASHKKIKRFIIHSTVGSGTEKVESFILSGSNDGTNFTTITTGNLLPSSSFPGGYVLASETVSFSNNNSYLFYRLNIIFELGGSGDGCNIVELEMMELIEVAPPTNSELYKQAVDLDTYKYFSLVSVSPVTQANVFSQIMPISLTLQPGANATAYLTNNNLTSCNVSGSNQYGGVVNIPKSSGKWYLEYIQPNSIMFSVGVKDAANTAQNHYAAMPSISYLANHIYQGAGGGPLCPTAPPAGTIMSVAYDIENHHFSVQANGVLFFEYDANPTYYLTGSILFFIGTVSPVELTINAIPTYEIPGYNFIN